MLQRGRSWKDHLPKALARCPQLGDGKSGSMWAKRFVDFKDQPLSFCCFMLITGKAMNGTPLQYSCLENPMGGGAWWAAVHGVAKSQT